MECVNNTMSKSIIYVGLDVHAESIVAAVAEAGGDVCHQGSFCSDLHSVDKFLARHPCEGITTNHSNQHE
jgi:hypothetical protein